MGFYRHEHMSGFRICTLFGASHAHRSCHFRNLRLIDRKGEVWTYTSREALARDLIAGGFYKRGGWLTGEIVERLSTAFDEDGRRYENGQYVVELGDGTRLNRGEIIEACVAYNWARRRRSRVANRGWFFKPRRRKVMTKADRKAAIHARMDLREFDDAWIRIVEPDCRIDDPYEARPRRTPMRSWKAHRAHQYR